MSTRLFWSWFVIGSWHHNVADQIKDIIGEDHVALNGSELSKQLGQVVYILSRVYNIQVESTIGHVTIKGDGFTLSMTEKWMM